MATINDLLTEALQEIGAIDPSEAPSASDTALALSKFNQILDRWNAERQAVYADVFSTFTITPSLSPHTIGPTGTWVVTQRPVSIEGASIIQNVTSPYPYVPMTKRDAQWWQAQTVPTLTTSWPTDFYYDPTWGSAGNGSFYMWPVPTTAYQVQLHIRLLLAQVAASDTFTMPPAYKSALILTLAEDLTGPFRSTWTQAQSYRARQARAKAFANNVDTPILVTADSGMPAAGAGRPNFNWLSGTLTR
jgi:hypothetical protein